MTSRNHVAGIEALRRRFGRDALHGWYERGTGLHGRLTVLQLTDKPYAVLHFLLNSLQFSLRGLELALGHEVDGVGLGQLGAACGTLGNQFNYLLLKGKDGR